MEFTKATKQDCLQADNIIRERQQWFIDNNIPQWHTITDHYHYDYYLSQVDNMYVLKNNQQLIAYCLVFFEDKFWQDDQDSIYIHSFVSRLGSKGNCKIFIDNLCKIFKDKKYIRIDCLGSSKKLTNIYYEQGFELVQTKLYDDGSEAALLQKQIKQ